jgi:hypothetical protein
LLKWADELKGAGNPKFTALRRTEMGNVLVVEKDTAAIGPVEPGDQIEQRGLARAVRSDQSQDFAFCQGEIDRPHRAVAAE